MVALSLVLVPSAHGHYWRSAPPAPRKSSNVLAFLLITATKQEPRTQVFKSSQTLRPVARFRAPASQEPGPERSRLRKLAAGISATVCRNAVRLAISGRDGGDESRNMRAISYRENFRGGFAILRRSLWNSGAAKA